MYKVTNSPHEGRTLNMFHSMTETKCMPHIDIVQFNKLPLTLLANQPNI